jgi:hypothetical protein
MFCIEILISLLASLPSDIEINLNNLNTLLPRSSETTQGVSGV